MVISVVVMPLLELPRFPSAIPLGLMLATIVFATAGYVLEMLLPLVVVSGVPGLTLARSRLFPGRTALWGFSAKVATVMAFTLRDHGADFRLVAFTP